MSAHVEMLQLELQEDVALPETSASASGQATLQFLPGAVLLGAAAGRLYRALSPSDAWTVFHSGSVRFGNGLPVHNHETAYPLPRCWFVEKGYKLHPGKPIPEERIRNPISDQGLRLESAKALRDGFTTRSGIFVKVGRNAQLRTAIDPATGRASDAQLFSYESIPAGSCFRSRVEFDDAVPVALREQVMESLTGAVFLGRSRTAEYGRVRTTRMSAEPLPASVPRHGELVLWLLSDLALIDAHGQPTFQPDGAMLGLGSGRLDPTRCYVAMRRYAPYNGSRRGHDRDRQVLAAGSVLVLTDVDSREDVIGRLAGGAGLHREQGLGAIAVNPRLLASWHPEFEPAGPIRPPTPAVENNRLDTSATTEAWRHWARSAQQQEQVLASHEEQAREWLKKWRALLEQARFHCRGDQDVGPSAAQWGAVRDTAAECSGSELVRRLFGTGGAAIAEQSPGWSDSIDAADQKKNLRAQLLTMFGESPDGRAVLAFAREAQKDARQSRLKRTGASA